MKSAWCYLITSKSKKFLHHTYIGFSYDVAHRLKQHNGKYAGGAKRTRRKKPWALVAKIGPFPDKRSALQFEWAWQHPTRTRFLKKSDQLHTLQPVVEHHFPPAIKRRMTTLYKLLSQPPWCDMKIVVKRYKAWLSTPKKSRKSTPRRVNWLCRSLYRKISFTVVLAFFYLGVTPPVILIVYS